MQSDSSGALQPVSLSSGSSLATNMNRVVTSQTTKVEGFQGTEPNQRVSQDLNDSAKRLVVFLENAWRTRFTSCVTEWAVDPDGECWLLGVSELNAAGRGAGQVHGGQAFVSAIKTDASSLNSSVPAPNTTGQIRSGPQLGGFMEDRKSMDDSDIGLSQPFGALGGQAFSTHTAFSGEGGQGVTLHAKPFAASPEGPAGRHSSALEESLDTEPVQGGYRTSTELEVLVSKLKSKLRKVKEALDEEVAAKRRAEEKLQAAKRDVVAAEAKASSVSSARGDVNESLMENIGNLTRRLEEAKANASSAQRHALEQLQQAHRQELLSMKGAFDDLEDNMAAMRMQLSQATQELGETKRASKALANKAQRYTIENERLSQELKMMRHGGHRGRPADLESKEHESPELRKLQLEVEELRSQLTLERTTKQELATSLARSIQEARVERRQLKGQLLQKDDDAIVQSMRSSQSAGKVGTSSLSAHSAEQATALGEAQAVAKAAQSSMNALEADMRRLRQALDSTKKENASLDQRLASSQRETEQYRHKTTSMQPIIDGMAAELKALRTQMAVSQLGISNDGGAAAAEETASNATVRRLEKQLQSANEEVTALTQQLDKARSIPDAAAQATLTMAAVDEAVAEAEDRLTKMFEAERQQKEEAAAVAQQAAVQHELRSAQAEFEKKLKDLRNASEDTQREFERQIKAMDKEHTIAVKAIEERLAIQQEEPDASAASESPVSVQSSQAKLLRLLRDRERQLRMVSSENAHALGQVASAKEEAAQRVASIQASAASEVRFAKESAQLATQSALSKLDQQWRRRYDTVADEARKARGLERELSEAQRQVEMLRTWGDEALAAQRESDGLAQRVMAEANSQVAEEISKAVADAKLEAEAMLRTRLAEERKTWEDDTAQMIKRIQASHSGADMQTVVAAARAEAEAKASARLKTDVASMNAERLRLQSALEQKERAIASLSSDLKTAAAQNQVYTAKCVAQARKEEESKLAERLSREILRVLRDHQATQAQLERNAEERLAAKEAAVRSSLQQENEQRVARIEKQMRAIHELALDAAEARHAVELQAAKKEAAGGALGEAGADSHTGSRPRSSIQAKRELDEKESEWSAREASLRATLAHTREELRTTRAELETAAANDAMTHKEQVAALQAEITQLQATMKAVQDNKVAQSHLSQGASGEEHIAELARAVQRARDEVRAEAQKDAKLHASKSITAMRAAFSDQVEQLRAAYDDAAARVMEDAESVVEAAAQKAAAEKQATEAAAKAMQSRSAAALPNPEDKFEADRLRGEIARLKGELVRGKEREAQLMRSSYEGEQRAKAEVAARDDQARSNFEARLQEIEATWSARLTEARAATDSSADDVRRLHSELSSVTAQLDSVRAQLAAEQAAVIRAKEESANSATSVQLAKNSHAEALRLAKEDAETRVSAMQARFDAAKREWAAERRSMSDTFDREKQLLLKSSEEEGHMNEQERRAMHERLMAESDNRLDELRERYDEQIRDMQNEHDAKMLSLLEKNTQAAKSLRKEFEGRLQEESLAAASDARREMHEAEEARVAQLEDRARRAMDLAMDNAAAEQQAALDALEAEHAARLSQLSTDFEEQLQRKDEERVATLDEASRTTSDLLQQAKQRHGEAMDQLQANMAQDMENAKAHLEQERQASVRAAVADALERAAKEAGGKHAELGRLLEEERKHAEKLEARIASDQEQLVMMRQEHAARSTQQRAAIERISMQREDALAVSVRLSPEAVEARIAEATREAERFLSEGLETAKQAMQAELDARVAEFKAKMERQADTFAAQRDEWVVEREQLRQGRDLAERIAKDSDAAREQALAMVQSQIDKAIDDANFVKEEALKDQRQRLEEERANGAARLRKEKDKQAAQERKAAKEEWENEKQVELAEMRTEYEARFKEFELESSNVQRSVVGAMEDKHRSAMEKAFGKALTDREHALKAVVEEKMRAIAEAEAKAKAEVDASREAATEILEKMKAEYSASLNEAEEKWAQEKATAVEAAITQAQATAQDTLQETQAVWQRRLEEVVAAKEQEMLAAVMDIKAEAKRLTDQHAQNMELLSMQGEDMRVRLILQHEKELKYAIEVTLEQAEAEKAAALAAFNREWEKRLAEREEELEAIHADAIARLRGQYADEMESAMNEMEQQRLSALNAFMEETKAEREKMAKEMQRRVQEAIEETEARAQARLEAAMQQAEEERLASIEDTLQRAAVERAEAVEEVRRQAAEEQEAAMEELREESEKLLGSIEGAMNKLREERDLTEEECAELREQLEAQEELAFKLRKEIENLRKAGVLQGLKLMHVVAFDIKKFNNMVRQKDEQRERALQKMEEMWEARVQEAMLALQAEKENVAELLNMQKALFETLTEHKRELLLDHKVQSTVLQNELAEIYDRKQILIEQKEGLSKGMGLMEGQIRQLEIEMQELSRQSILQDGKVNIALTRKKKRVDKDMDAMIIKVSEQHEKLEAMDKEMEGAEDIRIEKEEELKYVEAQLVNTLIEQQRKLMGVLQTVSVDPAKYGMDFAPGGGNLEAMDTFAPDGQHDSQDLGGSGMVQGDGESMPSPNADGM